ncbi:hypothetical protein KIK84_06060 [Curvibacter sp. CHRR-16]|uniref:cytochrome b562 n=1 Tax=Curvibacter sp. CHRR-16 TaxID=2835872 RepID=UPI001BDA4EC4|nr:cytochrome b562 [Curvibacter sp. CHRR-16]MBT0569883.1 hypothetical protein [Curvibacter sp. CHRR-16]
MPLSIHILRRHAAFALLAAAASTAVYASEVKDSMKEMARAYKAAMASQTMPEFADSFKKVQDSAKRIAGMQWKENQPLFNEGQQKLQKQLDAVAVQVSANNLAGAKDELAKTDPIKKEYHKKLD